MVSANLKPGTVIMAENPGKGIATINYDGVWVCTLIYQKQGKWFASSEEEEIKKRFKKSFLCLLRYRPSPGQSIIIRKTGKEYAHGYLE